MDRVFNKILVAGIAVAALNNFWDQPVIAKGRFALPSCPLVTEQGSKTSTTLEPIELAPSKSEPLDNTHSQSNLKQAQEVNIVPLALSKSSNEKEEGQREQANAAEKQLAALWQSTIENSKDIQLAISILQPNTDKKHTASQATRMLSGLLFNVSGLMLPSGASRMPSQILLGTANGIVDRALGGKKTDKEPATAEQTTLTYLLVRSYANKLEDNFQQYKMALNEQSVDQAELDDSEQLLLQSRENENADAMSRHAAATRKMELSQAKVLMYRQNLIKMAGESAVSDLDKSIEDERRMLIQLIGKQKTGIEAIGGQAAKLDQEKQANPKDTSTQIP